MIELSPNVGQALLVLTMSASALAASARAEGSIPARLDFEDARELLLVHHPDLRVARADADRAAGRARDRARFPNPSVTVSEERTDVVGDGVDDQWYLTLQQSLRYPGEQSARSRGADATRRVMDARTREVAAQLYGRLRHRYLQVVTANARCAAAERLADVLNEIEDVARARTEVGDLATLERQRIQVARARFGAALADARHRLRDARVRLFALVLPDGEIDALADVLDAGPPVEGSLEYRPASVASSRALEYAEAHRSRLAAARHRVEVARAAADAAAYRRYPRFELAAGPKLQSLPAGTTFGYTAGLTARIPVWNLGDAAVAARAGEARQARAETASLRRTLSVSVLSRLSELRAKKQAIEAHRPALRAHDDMLEDAALRYRAGQIDLTDLLSAATSSYRARLLELDLLAGYFGALYDLERALGVGPEDPPFVLRGALMVQEAGR